MTRSQREDNETWTQKPTKKQWKLNEKIWWKIYSKKKKGGE